MIKYIEGNLFDADMSVGSHMIAHVTNNQGVWGAGFVIPLGLKYPLAKKAYLESKPILGRCQLVQCEVGVLNMCAQTLEHGRPLRYDALVECMRAASISAKNRNATIHCPLFGAGLAGGKWFFIHELIWDIWVDRNINVNVYWMENMLPSNIDRKMINKLSQHKPRW